MSERDNLCVPHHPPPVELEHTTLQLTLRDKLAVRTDLVAHQDTMPNSVTTTLSQLANQFVANDSFYVAHQVASLKHPGCELLRHVSQ